MYKWEKLFQFILILIGICVAVFLIFISTIQFSLRRNFEKYKQEITTTAAPPTESSKSAEWYQAAGQKMPE